METFSERYVRKLLPLAYLAPDIIDALLDGAQPAVLDLKKLLAQTVPISWNAQRQQFGFAV